MQDTNSNQLLGIICLKLLKNHLGSFTKYILIFSFELYFFGVGGSLFFYESAFTFPCLGILIKENTALTSFQPEPL